MNDARDLALSISRFKKENFLKEKSEDAFRDEIIRPLFYRLNYGDGQDLCGPMEDGKDVIFTEENKLGVTEIVAVQTKKGNLNLASEARRNVVNAIAQLRTALDTEIPLVNPKRKCLPDKVFLCASGKINRRAREHITNQVKDPRIQFLDSDTLIPLLDQHYPELWLGIDADIIPYFKAIKNFVEGISAGTDGIPETRESILSGAASDEAFLSLTLYRHYKRVYKKFGQARRDLAFEEIDLEELTSRLHRKVLILGEAGAGKSTALKRLAYQLVKKGITGKGRYFVPIYLRATDIASQCDNDLLHYCDQHTRRIAQVRFPCFTTEDLEEGRVFVFVDGLDEVAGNAEREKVVGLVNGFAADYPKTRFYITARPYDAIRQLSSTPDYVEYTISPISWKQAANLYRKVREQRSLPDAQSKELLRRVEQIHGIELNPLMVTVFAVTSDYDRKDVPANITELFKKFTEWMLGRWDDRKGLSQQYHAPLKDFVLQKIAFDMHKENRTVIIEERFRSLCAELLRKRGHKADTEQLVDELLYRSGLLRIVGDDVEFRHHLIQEFFAGRGIESEDFIFGHISDEWWKRAIVFYFGENPSEIGRLVRTKNQIRDSQGGLSLMEAATTIGLSLQACYLSEMEEKLELWKWVNVAIGRSEKGVMEELSFGKRLPLMAFISFYLSTRDAVALSNLNDYSHLIEEWLFEETVERKDTAEAKGFLYIISLIEAGHLRAARDSLERIEIRNGEYLLAIYLGAFFWLKLRDLTAAQRDAASEICEKLKRQISHLMEQVLDEFGSHLLEMKQGQVERLDEDESHDSEVQ